MKSKSVQISLRRAAEAVRRAADTAATTEMQAQLGGLAEQLDPTAVGDPAEPEALVHPGPGVLDTIQRKLGDAMGEADPATARSLQEAQSELILAIVTLDDQWRRQTTFDTR